MGLDYIMKLLRNKIVGTFREKELKMRLSTYSVYYRYQYILKDESYIIIHLKSVYFIRELRQLISQFISIKN